MPDNKEWVVTDDDCMQMRRQIDSGVFMLFQIIEHPSYFRIAYGVIDVHDCDEEERKDLARTYSIDESELEGPEGEGLLAEMMFETRALSMEIPRDYATFSDAVKQIASFTGMDLSGYIPTDFHSRGEELAFGRIRKCLKDGVYEEITPAHQFETDVLAALMNDYNLNMAQARESFNKGYAVGHRAGLFEVLNAVQEYGSFAASILNSARPDKGAGDIKGLDGLKMRIPTDQEWIRLVGLTQGQDESIHWQDKFSWVHDSAFEKEYPAFRAYRGYIAPRFWDYFLPFTRDVNLGFRPAFDPLSADTLPTDIQDGDVIMAGTLYMDGKPVRVPQSSVENDDVTRYVPRARLTFGPAVEDPAYVVKAIAVGGIFIADHVMLCNISYEDIEAALR